MPAGDSRHGRAGLSWLNPEGRSHILSFLLHTGEEEDGDEDDEAEGATGKRAAEDDEVGRAAASLGATCVPGGLG